MTTDQASWEVPSSRHDDDRLREECGVFGILGHEDAASITALGLHALQHRGQEAAGIVSFDGRQFHSERRLGLVGENFNDASVIHRRPRPLLDDRRHDPAQRPAAICRSRYRRFCGRP